MRRHTGTTRLFSLQMAWLFWHVGWLWLEVSLFLFMF
jgi:hypothetical protein